MAFENEVKALQKVPFFRDVPAAKLRLLAYVGEKMTYAKDEAVFAQGSTADGVYVILGGEVGIYHNTPNGEHVFLIQFGEGMSFGEIGVLSGNLRNVAAVAASKLCVLRINNDDFLDLVRQVPQLAFAIIRELSQRLEYMFTRVSADHAA